MKIRITIRARGFLCQITPPDQKKYFSDIND